MNQQTLIIANLIRHMNNIKPNDGAELLSKLNVERLEAERLWREAEEESSIGKVYQPRGGRHL